jgi:hypothetical protein
MYFITLQPRPILARQQAFEQFIRQFCQPPVLNQALETADAVEVWL